MNGLLDTVTLMLATSEPNRVPDRIAALIQEGANDIVVSAVNCHDGRPMTGGGSVRAGADQPTFAGLGIVFAVSRPDRAVRHHTVGALTLHLPVPELLVVQLGVRASRASSSSCDPDSTIRPRSITWI